MPISHKEIKGILEALHGKIDALSAEVTALREEVGGAMSPVAVPTVEASDTEAVAPVEPLADDPERARVQEAVYAFVQAAMIKADEACWAELAQWTHSSEKEGPRSLHHLKAFTWKKLRKSAHRYLEPGGALNVVRSEPERVGEATEMVKLFLAHGVDSSSPITLARDAAADGAWRVQRCSL